MANLVSENSSSFHVVAYAVCLPSLLLSKISFLTAKSVCSDCAVVFTGTMEKAAKVENVKDSLTLSPKGGPKKPTGFRG